MDLDELYISLDKQIGRLLNARDRIKAVDGMSATLTEGQRRDILSAAVSEMSGACDTIRALPVLDAVPTPASTLTAPHVHP